MTSVVSELGSNHCGSLDLAKKLIDASVFCGAQAVKLQKRDNKSLYTKAFYKAPYNSESAYGPTYGEHREALEFGLDEYRTLKGYAESKGLTFFATAFDFPSVDFLSELGCAAVKIASGDATNIPLIRYAKDSGMRLVISTGGCDWSDVDRIVETAGPECFTLLHCTASYPCKPENLNLRVIPEMISRYPGVTVGFSSHFNGISMPLAAAAMGAKVIEVHTTLDRASRGTDHAMSLEPQGLRKLCRDLERLDEAMGDGVKKVHECELEALQKMGKSLVASRKLMCGSVLSSEDIAIKSPGGGFRPYRMGDLVGRMLTKSMDEEEAFEWACVQAG